jgi:hypothetical protein
MVGREVIGSVCDANLTKTLILNAENKKGRTPMPRERPDCKPVVKRYGPTYPSGKINRNIYPNNIGGSGAEIASPLSLCARSQS